MDKEKKSQAILKLEETYRKCTKCILSRSSKKVVHWRGNLMGKLCIIGEAPSREEDLSGYPFDDKSGRLLDKLIEEADLNLEEDVIMTYAVCCRTPNNRAPLIEEFRRCKKRLELFLNIVRPKALLLVGLTSAKFLANINNVGKSRGNRLEVEMFEPLLKEYKPIPLRTYPALLTYHPAYLMRNGLDKNLCKIVVSDIKKVWSYTNE